MEDVEDVDVEEVEICDLWPSMFFMSAMEFCISPRSRLTASADDDVAEEEAVFDEDEEDERDEDINR